MAEATAPKKKSDNFVSKIFGKMSRFFKEGKSEMKKVVWPSRKQVTKNTIIVIAAVLLIGIVIWVLDLIFQFGLSKIIAR